MQKYNLLLFVCFSLSMVGQEIQLSWKKDFNLATELAKSEKKPILVYFTKNDCSDCLQFYTDFFKQDEFKSIADQFVLLMLDGSNNDIKTTDISVIKLRRLVMHYNKSSTFPAVLALDKDGKELSELFTASDKNAILNYLNTLKSIN